MQDLVHHSTSKVYSIKWPVSMYWILLKLYMYSFIPTLMSEIVEKKFEFQLSWLCTSIHIMEMRHLKVCVLLCCHIKSEAGQNPAADRWK